MWFRLEWRKWEKRGKKDDALISWTRRKEKKKKICHDVPCSTLCRSLWAWFSSFTIIALSRWRWCFSVLACHTSFKWSIGFTAVTLFITNFGSQRNLNGRTASFGYDLTSFDLVAKWALWLNLKITTWAIFTLQTSKGTGKFSRRTRNTWHGSSVVGVRTCGALLRWTVDSCACKASLTSWLCSVDSEKSWWNFVATGRSIVLISPSAWTTLASRGIHACRSILATGATLAQLT